MWTQYHNLLMNSACSKCIYYWCEVKRKELWHSLFYSLSYWSAVCSRIALLLVLISVIFTNFIISALLDARLMPTQRKLHEKLPNHTVEDSLNWLFANIFKKSKEVYRLECQACRPCKYRVLSYLNPHYISSRVHLAVKCFVMLSDLTNFKLLC